MDTNVKVTLRGDTETKKRWLVVSVKSNVCLNAHQGEIWNHKRVDIEGIDGETVKRDLQQAAELVAAYQCQVHRDMHDPRTVGRAALAALEDLKRQADEARRSRGSGR
jgi:hypothetical protein